MREVPFTLSINHVQVDEGHERGLQPDHTPVHIHERLVGGHVPIVLVCHNHVLIIEKQAMLPEAHTMISTTHCHVFALTGTCSNGELCRLPHISMNIIKARKSAEVPYIYIYIRHTTQLPYPLAAPITPFCSATATRSVR